MNESLFVAVDRDCEFRHSSISDFDRDCEVVFPSSVGLLNSFVDLLGTSDKIVFEEATKLELLGKDFNTEQEAYDSYNEYAFRHGFGIRIDKSKTRNDYSLKMKRFVCCIEGWKDDKAKNKRFMDMYKHYMKHNHHMIPLEKRQLLRSQRSVSKENLQFSSALRCSGVKISATLRAMKKDIGGSPNLGFTGPDAYNALSAEKRSLVDGCDSHQLIKYFAKR
ncbi:uncharacterized protein LOC110736633 [Chenopodium quinoa]|uniref:uncharacterized protein LOC110736633 n=1 Tax=Chenopodium quinoa TaxID=63459 RepID=UPI000B77ABE0|nr:uncharacterized protein LOC110736633 [Chenopodium quinoa]